MYWFATPFAIAGAALAAATLPVGFRKVVKRFRSRERIPLPEAEAFRHSSVARRTRFLRAAFASALVGSVAAAAVVSLPERATPLSAFVPRVTNGVIVIDASGSIGESQYGVMGEILEAIVANAAPGSHFGLVVFSDEPYVALPPEADPEALQQVIATFLSIARKDDVPPRPGGFWSSPRIGLHPFDDFSGGTYISPALVLANTMLRERGYRGGTIILISDLIDSMPDIMPLQFALSAIRREGRDLRVIMLPSRGDATPYLQIFRPFLRNKSDLIKLQTFRGIADASKNRREEKRMNVSLAILILVIAAVAAGDFLFFGSRLQRRRTTRGGVQ